MSTADLDDAARSAPRTPRRASADRFIPSSISRDRLVLSRHPDRLTRREKLARTLSSGPDPFGANVPRTPIRHRAGSSPASFGRGTSTVNGRRTSLNAPPSRRLSQGAVWGIGGATAVIGDSVAGVPDGRGRLLASGTNASLYSSNFLRRRDSNGELDVHERRLAIALELDTASRVLSYNGPAISPDSGYGSSTPSPPQIGAAARAWRDGQWNLHEALSSEIQEAF